MKAGVDEPTQLSQLRILILARGLIQRTSGRLRALVEISRALRMASRHPNIAHPKSKKQSENRVDYRDDEYLTSFR
jgi:hypothetical protein